MHLQIKINQQIKKNTPAEMKPFR